MQFFGCVITLWLVTGATTAQSAWTGRNRLTSNSKKPSHPLRPDRFGFSRQHNRTRWEYSNNPGVIVQITQNMMNEMSRTFSQIITSKVRGLRLPDKHSNVGRISMTFTNLQVTEITPPKIEIHPSPNTPHQLTASMQVDQLAVHGEVVSSMRLLDDREFYVTLNDVAINVHVTLRKTPSGQMRAEITGCNFYLGDVSVESRAANRNRFSSSRIAERKLRNQLESKMCDQIVQKGGKALNTLLERYPTKVQLSDMLGARKQSNFGGRSRAIGSPVKSANSLGIFAKETNVLRNVALDTSLVSDPKAVSPNLLQLDFRGNPLWMGRSPAPFNPSPIRTASRSPGDSTLIIYVSESVLNTLLYHLHNHGMLKLRIDKNSRIELSSLLRNNCHGWFCLNSFLPQFRAMYPSHNPVIYLSTTSPPVVHIDPRMMTIEIEARISLHAENGAGSKDPSVEALTLDIRAVASGVPFIEGNRLKAKILSATMKSTTVRDTMKVDPGKVEVLVDILRKAFEDGVQSIGKTGFRFPQSGVFVLQNGRVHLLDRAIEFDLTLRLNERFLMEKMKGLFGGLMA